MYVVVLQLLSHFLFFATPWTAACQASLSFTISQSLLKLMSIESVMPSNNLILCHPCLLLPSMFPRIRVFSTSDGQSIGALASASVLPMNIQGWFFFRIDWFDLLATHGILKSLLQHTVEKQQFFSAQLSLWSNSHIHTWLLEKP